MQVVEKGTRITYEAFDITYDSATGYPHFLIYKDGQWIRRSAKHFVPVADISPVIYCRDCRHFKYGDYCFQDKMEHSKCRPDDFCSYAEMREGDGDDEE